MYNIAEMTQTQQQPLYQLIDGIFYNMFKDIPRETVISKQSKTGLILAKTIELDSQSRNISNYFKFNRYNSTIRNFYERLEDNFSSYDLNAFYQNIKTLKIKKQTISEKIETIIKKDKQQPQYNESNNTISLPEVEIKSRVNCELLRMATTRQNGNVLLTGFSQYHKDKGKSIGHALNRGYTEYINRKYFSDDELEEYYSEDQVIAQGIEKIVGSRIMEQLFFKADLKGLIDELSKYTSIEHAMDLIRKFDQIHLSKNPVNDYKELRELISQIYLKQQKQLVESGKISQTTYNERKLIHADIYVNEAVVFDEGAQLIEKDKVIKIVDSNRGVAVITHPSKYNATNNEHEQELSDIFNGEYSYRDDYQRAVELEQKRRG